MYLIQPAIPNMGVGGIAKSFTTKAAANVKNLLHNAIDSIAQNLQLCLRWTSSHVSSAIAALWRASRIEDLLHLIKLLVLRILKWCGIALVTVLGIMIIWRLGYWGLPKLWSICMESLERSMEERLRNNERRRLAAAEDELRLKQAAQAARLKEAKLRQIREEQAIKDRLRREEEDRQAKGKADYARWEKECDIVFRDKSTMTKFPFPPLSRCTNLHCWAFTKIPVPACKDNVKQFLRGSGRFSIDLLKHQKNLWHEDRFTSCREDLKPEFQRLANSLFVVLYPLYEELKETAAK